MTEVEILMTNLGDQFSISDLAETYRLRWGIGTCFSCVKNHQMLGTFSGCSEVAVKQDIWCNLIFYNLQAISSLAAMAKVAAIAGKRRGNPAKRKKKENRGYQLNRNIGTNTLRMYLPSLLRCPENQLKKLLDEMQVYYLQSLEMIKETKLERKRKMLRQNDRHQTEENYKRGF
jgi:hypothetical protein